MNEYLFKSLLSTANNYNAALRNLLDGQGAGVSPYSRTIYRSKANALAYLTISTKPDTWENRDTFFANTTPAYWKELRRLRVCAVAQTDIYDAAFITLTRMEGNSSSVDRMREYFEIAARVDGINDELAMHVNDQIKRETSTA